MTDRTPPGIPRPPVNKRGWIVGGALLVVFVVGASAYLASTARTNTYNPNNSREAISQCEARIGEQLKSPATADYNSEATGNGTWTVTGVVDSENSFGANVRSTYQCTVTVVDSDSLSTRIDYIR